METALSLQDKWTAVRECAVTQGTTVPWEVNGYYEDFEVSQGPSGGIFDMSFWRAVQVKGADAFDFLQRLSTVNLKELGESHVKWGGFLTAKAGWVGLGLFQRFSSDDYHLWFPREVAASVLAHLEKFHFAEKLTLQYLDSRVMLATWRAPETSLNSLGNDFDFSPMKVNVYSEGARFWRDDCRAELVWFTIERSRSGDWYEWARTVDLRLMGVRLFDYFRVKAAVPQLGREFSENALAMEANFDRSISRDKGCYPGQEVVERVATYGRVNQKLIPVEFLSDRESIEVPYGLSSEGIEVGKIVSVAQSPDRPMHWLGLALIRKTH